LSPRNQPDGEVLFFSNFDEQEAFDKVWTVSTNTDYTGAACRRPARERLSHYAGS
jgi:hypothetical protein